MGYIGRDEFYEEPLAQPTAMWTDLYELTMAQTLFLENRHNQQAVFNAFIRKTPFNSKYLVTAGQNIIAEWLDKNWKFTDRDLHRLAQKTVTDPATGEKKPIFKPGFLEMLKNAKMELSVDMMPEGELAFPGEPIYKVSGPIWQCLLVETAILNTMNSQSNFATYASILKTVANGKPVAEFGARRAQAVGALSPTRGAYVGGADASSNCWAETVYGINTIGTMAHAYVMMHEDEAQAFAEWAKHNPYLGAFLVDTYDTIEGVKRAITTCKEQGINLSGIRLDSGDLSALSKEARKLMDKAGFTKAAIVVSNDLDSQTINQLETEGAPINTYAVGTNLATVKEQPALGGVYKISAIYENGVSAEEIAAMKLAIKKGEIEPEAIKAKVRNIMKLSEDEIKMTIPGELDLIRCLDVKNNKAVFTGDLIAKELRKDLITEFRTANETFTDLSEDVKTVLKDNKKIKKTFNKETWAYRPLTQIFNAGKLVGDIETVHIARTRAKHSLDMLPAEYKNFSAPKTYPVYIEEDLNKHQTEMAKILKKTGNTVAANKL